MSRLPVGQKPKWRIEVFDGVVKGAQIDDIQYFDFDPDDSYTKVFDTEIEAIAYYLQQRFGSELLGLTALVGSVLNSNANADVVDAIADGFSGYGLQDWADKMQKMAVLERASRPDTDDEPHEGAVRCPECGQSQWAILDSVFAQRLKVQSADFSDVWVEVDIVNPSYDADMRMDAVMCLNCETVYDPEEGPQPVNVVGWPGGQEIVADEDDETE